MEKRRRKALFRHLMERDYEKEENWKMDLSNIFSAVAVYYDRGSGSVYESA